MNADERLKAYLDNADRSKVRADEVRVSASFYEDLRKLKVINDSGDYNYQNEEVLVYMHDSEDVKIIQRWGGFLWITNWVEFPDGNLKELSDLSSVVAQAV